jgi:lipoate-protein ligase B
MSRLDVFTPGEVEYREALDIQYELAARRADGEIPDTLILLEHNPVITFGRGGREENLLATAERLKERKVEIYKIERGGDVTFHGPGQLVGYPIIDLKSRGQDLHKYLRDLEAVLMGVAGEYGLQPERRGGYTGVWVGNAKIAAIGVAVRRWISFHGFALNVNNDLSFFDLIHPCGITDAGVGSLSTETKRVIDVGEVTGKVIINFKNVFDYDEVDIFSSLTGRGLHG